MPCTCTPDGHLLGPAPALVAPGAVRPSVTRRAVLAGGLAAGLVPFLPGLTGTAAGSEPNLYNSPDVTSKLVRPIMFPIVPAAGGKVNRLRNYGDDRGSHVHAGEDMMAPKLSKLLACVDGIVVRKVFGASGNYLYLKGTDGYHYGYLHINNDSPGTDDGKNPAAWAFTAGIVEGARVTRGQHIAWVGDSGNAEGSGSHLHFEIRKPHTKWYQSQAIDPEPSLDAAAAAVAGGGPAAEPATPTTQANEAVATTTTTAPPAPAGVIGPFHPFPTAKAFADRQARDFLGTAPTTRWTTAAINELSAGRVTPEAFIERQINDPAVTTVTNPVIRIYQAYFGGVPTYAGVAYWSRAVRAGTALDAASQQMADSAKFTAQYGRLTDRAFARRIYLNLYGSEPSAKVLGELLVMLDAGLSRGILTRAICESAQYRARSAQATRVVSVYHAMLRRAPTPTWRDRWAATDKSSRDGLATLISSIRTGAEYRKRVG